MQRDHEDLNIHWYFYTMVDKVNQSVACIPVHPFQGWIRYCLWSLYKTYYFSRDVSSFLLWWWWIPLWVPCLGMPHARRLTCLIVAMIFASCVALRTIPPRVVGARHLDAAGCLWAGGSRRGHPQLNRIRPSTPSMLLDIDASFGVIGLGALSAFRLFTTSITPKRVRVVTDIDDTVKSSGNRRFFGIPLGGIDAQCKCTASPGDKLRPLFSPKPPDFLPTIIFLSRYPSPEIDV